jgi:hypothetical protein
VRAKGRPPDDNDAHGKDEQLHDWCEFDALDSILSSLFCIERFKHVMGTYAANGPNVIGQLLQKLNYGRRMKCVCTVLVQPVLRVTSKTSSIIIDL